jgi:stress response protein YsnF
MVELADSQNIIPLHEEAVGLSRETLATGRLRVKTVTRSRDELVNETVTTQEAQIERVPIWQICRLRSGDS